MTLVRIGDQITSEPDLHRMYTGGIVGEDIPEKVYEEGIAYKKDRLERLDDILNRYSEISWGLEPETQKVWKRSIFSLYKDCVDADAREEANGIVIKYSRQNLLLETFLLLKKQLDSICKINISQHCILDLRRLNNTYLMLHTNLYILLLSNNM